MNDTADVSWEDYNNGSCHHPRRRSAFEEGTSTNAVQAAPDSYGESEQRSSLDQIAVPEDYIRTRRRDVASGVPGLLPALVLCALLGAAGLVFFGGSHLLVFAPARTALAQPNPNCPAQALDSIETGCIAPKSDREAALRMATPNAQTIAEPTATTGGREPTKGVAQQALARIDIDAVTRAMKRNSSLPAPRVATVRPTESLPRLTPVPETKPTTIEGWKVREVLGETAVLEGPNGILRVASGDTVPGLGKVDSIVLWGSRWIVATSRGLISTP